MASSYPASKQVIANPAGTQVLSNPDHALMSGTVNDTLGSIQDVIGTTLGTNVLRDFAAAQFPVRATGVAATGTLVQTLVGGTLSTSTVNNTTIGTPAITGGTLTSPTINTPIIVTPTIRNFDGWQDANETWTYASATTITVPSDATTKYQKGDKIRLKQGGAYKYFYIVTVAATLLTVTGGTDYTVANAAITDNYYSHENPIGFPDWFNYTPTLAVAAGTAPTYTAIFLNRFKVFGKTIIVRQIWVNDAGGTAGAGGNRLTQTLPVTGVFESTGGYQFLGAGIFFESPGTGMIGGAVADSSTTVAFINSTGGNYILGDDQSSTVRRIGITFQYEI